MKILKLAKHTTQAFSILSEIKNAGIFKDIADVHFTADSLIAKVLYKDGQKYQIEIKALYEEPNEITPDEEPINIQQSM